MAYLRNEPVATDDLDVSQPKLRDNTNTSDTSFGLNHYAFSDLTANNGKHKFCSFPNQTASPGTAAAESALYAKNVGSTSTSEIFVQKQGVAAAGADIQLSLLSKGVNSSQNGHSWLPGGILIQWGTGVASSAGTNNNFDVSFPTNCFGVTMSIQSNTVSSIHSVWCSTDPPSTTAFTAKSDSGTLKIFYFAIGN